MKQLLALTMFAGMAFGFVQEAKPLRVLFVGNSYTYYNNLPEIVAGLAAASGVKMEVRMIAHGGATLDQTWELDDVRQILHEGKWDYVVLQEHSQLGTVMIDGVQQVSEPEAFWESVRMYESEIRRVHAKTVLFLTWARKRDPAQDLGLTVAPVGMAWAKVREKDSGMALHLSDGSHPTPTGSYLAACVLLDTLLGKALINLPARIAGHPIAPNERVDKTRIADLVNIPAERAEFLQHTAADAHQKLADAGGYLTLAKQPSHAEARASLPPGRRPLSKELSGTWRGKMMFYSWPSTMELHLSSPDADHCVGQWSVTSLGGEHKLAGPIDSCRVTDTGIAFLVRDYRGLPMSESYWAHYTGEALVGWVEYRGYTKSSRMSGSWELRKER
jgi:hypothetical protein